MDVQFDKKFTEVTRNGSLIYESAYRSPRSGNFVLYAPQIKCLGKDESPMECSDYVMSVSLFWKTVVM